MKLPVSRKRTLITFAIADLIFAVLIFLSCFSLFVLQEWGVIQIIIIILFVGISVLMLVLSLARNFYVIESKYLVTVKGTKEMYYNYKDVVYIDKAQSEKKKVLCFYTNKGHVPRASPFRLPIRRGLQPTVRSTESSSSAVPHTHPAWYTPCLT